MNVYDSITADAVEVGDLIMVNYDQIEVTDVVDSGDSILIKGNSFVSGDKVNYILTADAQVSLWTE